MARSDSNEPMIPLPNAGEGEPVYDSGRDAVIPLPNPGEGGPVYDPSQDAVIPLPNPGEGGPVYDPSQDAVIPLPNPGEGGPVYDPGFTAPVHYAAVRFLNAAYGYGPFRIRINRTRVVGYLSFAAVSAYGRVPSGYQTVTVTSTDGYVYIQKTLPFEAGVRSTVAIINTAGGLDLLQIPDANYRPSGGYGSFRVSNLAYNSRPMDVLLADGRVVYADVRYKETTVFKRIRPGQYEFLFAETNQAPMPINFDIETLDSAFLGEYPVPNMVASLYLNVHRGRIYTVYLLSSGRGTNNIQTMVVID
ncbi:MAG: DUF4397 domain-containing protein [Oscillospiraceae bacterium]|nr:DUF4397 domain-containing protein [Oscillospiraceae bacterium]